MSETEDKSKERIADLGDGMAIWKLHVDCLREADKNARVMSPQVFERLALNVKSSGVLESLPLAHMTGDVENLEFTIISGHHRTRAARVAEVFEIHVLVIEKELTKDQILSKQISHNSLNGDDDQDVLRELYKEIGDINSRIEAGVAWLEEDVLPADIGMDEISFDLEFEYVSLLFLPHQYDRFEKAMGFIEKDKTVVLARIEAFASFCEAVNMIRAELNIKNLPGIVAKMSDIVIEHYTESQNAE